MYIKNLQQIRHCINVNNVRNIFKNDIMYKIIILLYLVKMKKIITVSWPMSVHLILKLYQRRLKVQIIKRNCKLYLSL
jgi:hypothetical protein